MSTIRHPAAASGRTRGAARVSIIWMISAFVLFFVAVAIAYIGFEDAAKYKRAAEQAQAAREEADERFTAESGQLSELSKNVGFYDPEAAVQRTNLQALNAAFTDLKASIPDLKDDVTDLAKALPVVTRAYKERGQQIATLESSKETLVSEKATMETALRDSLRQKDEELANLRRQLQDATTNAQQKQSELEKSVANLRSQLSSIDADLRTARSTLDEEKRRFDEREQTFKTRTDSVMAQLAFTREPESPDGRVLAVSRDLGLGWIDLGARDRLARGTRFRVVSGRSGSDKIKAWAEVTKVENDRAEVRFYDLADRFDPVVQGDTVYNPVYDSKMGRQAVLAGRFTAPYDEKDLRALLSQMGIEVQQSLDMNTDYLIVGSDLFVDEEGEPLEEPLSPVELPVYKDAEAMGVQIVPVKSLMSYFKL